MQGRKHFNKMNRNRVPCVRCGSDEHPTRDHGKDAKQVAQERHSRANNPRDPEYVQPRSPATLRTENPVLRYGAENDDLTGHGAIA